MASSVNLPALQIDSDDDEEYGTTLADMGALPAAAETGNNSEGAGGIGVGL